MIILTLKVKFAIIKPAMERERAGGQVPGARGRTRSRGRIGQKTRNSRDRSRNPGQQTWAGDMAL